MKHVIQAWGSDDREYTVNFRYIKAVRATLEEPGNDEDIEIEEVFCDGKEIEPTGKDLDHFVTQAWEYMSEEVDPPSDWKREWECNYER